MKLRMHKIISLILSEAISTRKLQRVPEPNLAMEDPENIKAFHEQGDPMGYLLPIYHFNAVAASRLLPHGGTVLDLGCGSGQYLMYLAKCRPDIRIVGLDLSAEMVSLGNATIKESALHRQVELIQGDMADFSGLIPDSVDLISSIFAFHHLPDIESLQKCLSEIANVCNRFGCAFWSFDHARPKLRWTALIFPEIFTPEASFSFRQDSTNSMIASFSLAELSETFDTCFNAPVIHRCSKLMRLYQVHWSRGFASDVPINQQEIPRGLLTPAAQKEFRSLCWLFNSIPLIGG